MSWGAFAGVKVCETGAGMLGICEGELCDVAEGCS